MSEEREQTKSLLEMAKDWFLSLTGLDEEGRVERSEALKLEAMDRIIKDHPDFVRNNIAHDQMLSLDLKERAYQALAGLSGDKVTQGHEVALSGSPEVYVNASSRLDGPDLG